MLIDLAQSIPTFEFETRKEYYKFLETPLTRKELQLLAVMIALKYRAADDALRAFQEGFK